MSQSLFTIPANVKGILIPEWILESSTKVVIRWKENLWTSNPNVPPHDYDAKGNPNYKASDTYLYPGALEGSLVACIGNPAVSKWKVDNFGIIGGDHLSTGPLWVACNDDWNAVGGNGYTDNKGSVTIEVILYSEFLQELTDEKTMQSFIETFSYKVGIDTIEKLQEAIKNNSDKLLLLSSESSTLKVGQYAVEDSTLANA